MKYPVGTIRRFKVKEGFAAEGRKFYSECTYEAKYKQWDVSSLNVTLFAENGYFNFTPELFERVIKAWELEELI